MRKRESRLLAWLNQLKLRQKLWIMQIFCVILPLLLTDSVIVSIITYAERQADVQEMNNIADSVEYTIMNYSSQLVLMMQDIYRNREVNEFINGTYTSPLDYYNQHLNFAKASLFGLLMNSSSCNVVIYTDAEGIVSGGNFQRMEKAQNEAWYQAFMEQDKDILLYADFAKINWEKRRVISFVRHMDYLDKEYKGAVLRLDWDYGNISRTIANAKYSSTVYVCDGNTILFSNERRGGINVPYEVIPASVVSNAGFHKTIRILDGSWDIYVMPRPNNVYEAVRKNLPLFGMLLLLNLFLPFTLMNLINRSFTQRLRELEAALRSLDRDELCQLPEISGADEISLLMESYNEMAVRMNDLIQNEYKSRLKRQEYDIARQKAELLALQSQINPHFLFNALESIRMHSVIKGEFETADMVEKLAVMQRQNVAWGNDYVTIDDEINFVKAYLELQKYRFGDRLCYEIQVDGESGQYRLPRLTLVTFVENACVHGMEKKESSCWVFVRVFQKGENLILEVEDTGQGMSETKCRQLVQEMNEARIEMLQENKSVGILNAALRLKLFLDNQVKFELDSETGVGTLVTIRIPLEVTRWR
ncbi:MAG: histidine kinase [bacterium]|nr:histidine kinase [bacterium]MCM1374786.1 histidine kinase [Muribaculum sp.]